jgi:hypothetical protein
MHIRLCIIWRDRQVFRGYFGGNFDIGSSNLKGVLKEEVREKRKNGYGYATYAQKEEASLALKETGLFVTAYLDNVL